MWTAMYQDKEGKGGADTSDTADDDLDLDNCLVEHSPAVDPYVNSNELDLDDEEDEDEGIPESLKDFVQSVKKTLESHQEDFRQMQQNAAMIGSGFARQDSEGMILDSIGSPESMHIQSLHNINNMTESQVKLAALGELGFSSPSSKQIETQDNQHVVADQFTSSGMAPLALERKVFVPLDATDPVPSSSNPSAAAKGAVFTLVVEPEHLPSTTSHSAQRLDKPKSGRQSPLLLKETPSGILQAEMGIPSVESDLVLEVLVLEETPIVTKDLPQYSENVEFSLEFTNLAPATVVSIDRPDPPEERKVYKTRESLVIVPPDESSNLEVSSEQNLSATKTPRSMSLIEIPSSVDKSTNPVLTSPSSAARRLSAMCSTNTATPTSAILKKWLPTAKIALKTDRSLSNSSKANTEVAMQTEVVHEVPTPLASMSTPRSLPSTMMSLSERARSKKANKTTASKNKATAKPADKDLTHSDEVVENLSSRLELDGKQSFAHQSSSSLEGVAPLDKVDTKIATDEVELVDDKITEAAFDGQALSKNAPLSQTNDDDKLSNAIPNSLKNDDVERSKLGGGNEMTETNDDNQDSAKLEAASLSPPPLDSGVALNECPRPATPQVTELILLDVTPDDAISHVGEVDETLPCYDQAIAEDPDANEGVTASMSVELSEQPVTFQEKLQQIQDNKRSFSFGGALLPSPRSNLQYMDGNPTSHGPVESIPITLVDSTTIQSSDSTIQGLPPIRISQPQLVLDVVRSERDDRASNEPDAAFLIQNPNSLDTHNTGLGERVLQNVASLGAGSIVQLAPQQKVKNRNIKQVTMPKVLGASSRLLQGTASSRANAAFATGPGRTSEKVRVRVSQTASSNQKPEKLQAKEPTRSSKFSAEEARARAKERVRQMQLKQKTAEEKENKTKSNQIKITVLTPGLANTARTKIKVVTRADAGPTMAQTTKHRATIPVTPHFATTARIGEPVPRSRALEATLAQSTNFLMKNLRHDDVSTCSGERMRLTIPHAPHFATTEKYGERVLSAQGRSKDNTLAGSSQLLQNMLRSDMPSLRERRELKPTIPQTPKFQESRKRELPKGAAEKEKEMMTYYKSHPFKARPLKKDILAPKPVVAKPVIKRVGTQPVPFQLRTEHRGVAKPPVTKRENNEVKTSNGQFKARPLPDFSKATTPVAATKKSITACKARLSLGSQNSDKSAAEIKPFRARPVPKSLYSPPTPRATTPGDLSTANNSSRHAGLKRAENSSQMKNTEVLEKKAVQPFTLRSTARHEAYQRQQEEKLKAEEEFRRKQALFQARSYNKSPAPDTKVRSEKHTTSPKPFQLKSIARHEAQEEEMRRKRDEEELQRKRQASFKAKPVPRTTYMYKPISPRFVSRVSGHDPALPKEVSIPSPQEPLSPNTSSGAVSQSLASGFNDPRSPLDRYNGQLDNDRSVDRHTNGHNETSGRSDGAEDISAIAENLIEDMMKRLNLGEGAKHQVEG